MELIQMTQIHIKLIQMELIHIKLIQMKLIQVNSDSDELDSDETASDSVMAAVCETRQSKELKLIIPL